MPFPKRRKKEGLCWYHTNIFFSWLSCFDTSNQNISNRVETSTVGEEDWKVFVSMDPLVDKLIACWTYTPVGNFSTGCDSVVGCHHSSRLIGCLNKLLQIAS